MAKHQSYGSFDESSVEEGDLDKEERRASSDTMRSQGRGGERPHSADGRRRKEDVEMHPLADQASIEESESDSDQSAQAGVKRAEAISTTWTKTSLYAAYLGYDTPCDRIVKSHMANGSQHEPDGHGDFSGAADDRTTHHLRYERLFRTRAGFDRPRHPGCRALRR